MPVHRLALRKSLRRPFLWIGLECGDVVFQQRGVALHDFGIFRYVPL